MAAWNPAALLLLLGNLLALCAASDICDSQAWGQSWVAEALQTFCQTPVHVAYRSSPCTVVRLCGANGSHAPVLGADICKFDRLVLTVCGDFPELPECLKLRETFASETSYGRCMERQARLVLPNTAAVEAFLAEACAPGRRLSGCSECNAESCRTPDPLLAYTAACAEVPEAQGCDAWVRFCTEVSPAAAGVLCSNPGGRTTSSTSTSSATSASFAATNGGGSKTAGAAAVSLRSDAAGSAPSPSPAPSDPCIADSSQPACKSYVYPDAAANVDIQKLCDAMPDMPGCAIARACGEGAGGVAAKYCLPFVLLATLCHDMPGMRGCDSYKALCTKPGSVVQQCVDQPAVPAAPTWSQARKAVFSACGDHPMAGCASCSKQDCPDPLASLAAICQEMPSMAVCGVFWAFCNAAGTEDVAEWCAADDSKYLPSMLMYFHQRTQELLLWKEWRPRTRGQYVASVVAILAMGLVATGLKSAKGALVLRWNHDRAIRGHQERPVSSVWMPRRGQWEEILIKSAITGVSLTLDYFNMLIAMTFNVGFFCAVIAGYILGTLVFSHVLENYGAILHQERRELAARMRRATQPHQQPLMSCAGLNANGRLYANGYTAPAATVTANGDKAPLLPMAAAAAGFGAGAGPSISDEDSEEELRLAIEGEGECNCVHSA